MIRKRDLVIFLVALLLLLCGIAITIIFDARRDSKADLPVLPSVVDDVAYTAENDQMKINRENIIDRLRGAIARNESTIEPSPSVEESEDSVSDTDVSTPPPDVVTCAQTEDTGSIIASWPQTGVSVSLEGSQRVYTQNTGASTTVQTLLRLPAYPVAGGEHCIQGEVIGVTVGGALMYNSQVSLYRGYGSEYLIGYARDGFPIYGYYEGAVDSCGGYTHPQGYRYSITPERSQVLNCFSGMPASF